MPRSLQEILDNADAYARKFTDAEPKLVADAAPLRRIAEAAHARNAAERSLAEAVSAARAAGLSWASIGAYLGTSGEAARQRYGAANQPDGPAPVLAPVRRGRAAQPRSGDRKTVKSARPAETRKITSKSALATGARSKVVKADAKTVKLGAESRQVSRSK